MYTKGISPDLNNNKNGIIGFYRFSIVNAASIILPVKLINFKAYQKSSAVHIDWTALNEINVDHYEVEKSVNGISFSMIGSVYVINNNFVNYTKTDPSPLNGNNFYRIKAIDKNGAITYTSIVLVIICNSKTSINIYPNPVQNKIVNIEFKNLPKVRYNFILYSSTGRMVFSKTIKHDGGSAAQNFMLPLNVKPGVYIVKLSNETSDFTSRIVVE